MAAQAVSRSDNALGAYYRRMKARLGPKQAIVATAHKIARIYYHLVKNHEAFEPMDAAEFEKQFRDREVANRRRKAAKLGMTVVDSPAAL
jgi:transposase